MEKNTGNDPDEEPGLVVVFWNEKKKKWGKFLPLEGMKAALDSRGKPQLQVRREREECGYVFLRVKYFTPPHYSLSLFYNTCEMQEMFQQISEEENILPLFPNEHSH